MESVFINGWTKETVIKHITDNFKGKAAVTSPSGIQTCAYLTGSGRKCAVGLFIPNGHPAQQYMGTSGSMLDKHPDLEIEMPLRKQLYEFQCKHDSMDESLTVIEQTNVLIDYIKGLN